MQKQVHKIIAKLVILISAIGPLAVHTNGVSQVRATVRIQEVSKTQPAPKTQPIQQPSGEVAVVAIVDNIPITTAQLEEVAAGKLIKLKTEEYYVKRNALDDLIMRTLLEKEAAARRISVEKLIQLEIESKIRPVTDEETKAVYESTTDRFRGIPEQDALKQIEASMRQQRISKRRAEFVDELRAKMKPKILLEPPRLDVRVGDNPSLGAREALVTIVEFSDFQCPSCARFVPIIKQLIAQYGDKVRIIFRDFPLTIHKDAPKAAEAASCANEQGKFWEMHDKLFSNQNNLRVNDLKRYAAEIGLDITNFSQCLDSGKYSKEWQEDMADGSRYGISGTPTFFINGRLVVGAVPYEVFAKIIDEELGRAQSCSACK